MSQTASNPHYLGQRLSFASALCTVHYIGPVTDTSGTWLGVEWDDAALGKHAGEHNGVQYFKCTIPSSRHLSSHFRLLHLLHPLWPAFVVA